MRSHDYLVVTCVSHDPFILCRYTQFTVYGDSDIARSAQMNTRYSMESLQGIIFDVHILSESEYIVCTFSSNVCFVSGCYDTVVMVTY